MSEGAQLSRRALLVPLAGGTFGIGLGRTLATIAATLLSKGWEVTVFSRRDLPFAKIEQRFGLRLDGIRSWTRPSPRPGGGVRRKWSTLREHAVFVAASRGYDLVWMQSPYVPMVSMARRSVLFTEFPFEREPRSFAWRRRLGSYDRILGNSEFTRRWIERYWGVTAEVFYPAVKEMAPGSKEPIILGVGRFTGGSRSKNQRELVEAFRQLARDGLSGWSLHLAGFVEDEAYLEAVRAAAVGLPVHLHLDLEAAELQDLFARSSIFWHGAGIGVDPELEPHRLEHFGIVTAEAMTAGCVPMAFDRGGPAEVVRDGIDGCLWHQTSELVEGTRLLIDQPSLRRELAANAQDSAKQRFGSEAFTARLERLLSDTEQAS